MGWFVGILWPDLLLRLARKSTIKRVVGVVKV